MTDLPPLICRRCNLCTHQLFENQIYCDECRRVIISAENASNTPALKKDIAIGLRQYEHSQKIKWTFDIEILDEYGNLVWALDLAQRYRKELNARQQRDFRERKN